MILFLSSFIFSKLQLETVNPTLMNHVIDISVLENLPTAVLLAELNGNIKYVNVKFKEIFGYKLSEIPNIKDWWTTDCFEGHLCEQDEIWSSLVDSLNSKTYSKEYRLKLPGKNVKNILIEYRKLENSIFLIINDVTLSKQYSSELQNNQSINKIIEYTLPGIFYVYDENNRLINFNEEHATRFGYTPDEIRNRHVSEWFKDEKEDILKAFAELYEGSRTSIEINFLDRTNNLIPYVCTGICFEHNGRKLFCGVGLDISDRILAQAAQKESEIKYKALINAFPDIILISDLDGKPLYANPALEQQTGLSHIDFQKNHESKFIHPEDETEVRQKVFELLYSNRQNSTIIENRFIDKVGRIRWYSGLISIINFEGRPALQIISRDITKNKEAELALIDSEQRMSSIFDNAPVAMLLLNEKREVLQINKKGLLYLRKSREESINLPFGDVYKCLISFNNEDGCGSGEQCKECLIKRTVEDTYNTGKTHFKVEVTLDTLDGKRFFHLSTAQLKLNNRKEILTSIDDITKRKSIEIELKISKEKAEESDMLKTAFLQNMSHEIRTPLNGILGFLDLLNNKDISDEEKGFYLNVINESSNELLSIVDNILSLSRLESEKLEVNSYEVNLNNIIGDLFFVYNTKAKEKNIFVNTHKGLSYNDSEVFGDSAKIRLILENLLNNAIKFTHEGHIKYGYYIEEGQIVFFVEDTGIGIEEIYFNKIFDRFQQIDYDLNRKYGGTGLGLTIAKGNVELLGGKIWLKSEPNKGSTFYFSLPYKPVNEPISAIKETTEHTSDNIPVILVAEDEEINYIYIEEALKDEPIKIIHAFDGREAVKYCKENSEISLVLMDIKMPQMDGYVALAKIKEFRPKLPIVAQTAYAFFSDKQRALEAGFNDYISKPIKKEQLVDIIHKYVKQTV